MSLAHILKIPKAAPVTVMLIMTIRTMTQLLATVGICVQVIGGNDCVDNLNDASLNGGLNADLAVLDQKPSIEFNRFEQRLVASDDGMKSKSSEQQVFQVKTIVSVIDPSDKKPSKLK